MIHSKELLQGTMATSVIHGSEKKDGAHNIIVRNIYTPDAGINYRRGTSPFPVVSVCIIFVAKNRPEHVFAVLLDRKSVV